MFSRKHRITIKGFSLIEMLVVISISVIVFAGLFASFEYSLKLIAGSRGKMTALSLATDRVEYIRSLTYDQVGTVSGIPNGNIPQNRTVTLNGIDFDERILIEYVDDPADGLGALDSNSVVADYKKIKVEYTWNIYNSLQSFSLISNVVPRSIETTTGGGTLRVNVFNAGVAALPGIDVRLLNTNTTSTIDVTRKTDATGTAYFTGAPAAAGYEIFVSAPGYSSDQTHQATTALPSPNTLPVAVLESDVSTMNFQVDKLSQLTVTVYDDEVIAFGSETFNDSLGFGNVDNVAVESGNLVLTNLSGSYEDNGFVLLNPVTPASLEAWGIVQLESSILTDTDVRVRFYTSTSTESLIPDHILPGNLMGFTESNIDLSGLDVGDYPSLVIGINLSTTNDTITPSVSEVTIFYVESRNELAGIPINLHGNKVIGTDIDAAPVYKHEVSDTSDGSGKLILSDMEWDAYTIDVGSSYVIKEACPANPFFLDPDTEAEVLLWLTSASAHNLRVSVKDEESTPVIGAQIELSRGASVWNEGSSWCGQAYFGSLNEASDYTLEVSAPGYNTVIMSSTTISGSTIQEIFLVSS